MQLKTNYNIVSIIKNISVAVLLSITLYGCKPEKKDGYDQGVMLSNLANNVIIPAHQQFSNTAATLQLKSDAFTANPTEQGLIDLKLAFLATYEAYMAVETFDFSPSAGIRNLNVFATDSDQINTNITSGTYNLDAAINIGAKGFPAIDYLLYRQENADIVSAFTGSGAVNRRKYLSDLTNEINTMAGSALSGWNSYVSTFTSATGTDIGSSVGMLVNDIAFETEKCRRERVGNSLGYVGFISSGTIHPRLLEGFNAKHSKELLITNLQQLKVLYEGSTGQGFDDYLANLNADYYGEPLASAISNQFELAIAKANAVSGDFTTALSTNKPQMEELFLELKKLTVMLKVDMSSQLGVVINYSDNDGD